MKKIFLFVIVAVLLMICVGCTASEAVLPESAAEEAGAFLLGEKAGFITGTDLLIDGGVIAAIRTGCYSLNVEGRD